MKEREVKDPGSRSSHCTRAGPVCATRPRGEERFGEGSRARGARLKLMVPAGGDKKGRRPSGRLGSGPAVCLECGVPRVGRHGASAPYTFCGGVRSARDGRPGVGLYLNLHSFAVGGEGLPRRQDGSCRAFSAGPVRLCGCPVDTWLCAALGDCPVPRESASPFLHVGGTWWDALSPKPSICCVPRPPRTAAPG